MSLRTSWLFNKLNLEILLLALILWGAAWLRFSNLVSIPLGFHGDEAVSGLEGQRILREGSIGPYTLATQGQPTGPLYLTALFLRYFGSTIWAVRAPSALLGTLTVLVLYLLLRRFQGRMVALVGASLLATLHWHIHFSRIGFPVIAWPLCTLLAVGALLEATNRDRARWWAIGGFMAGVGLYSYNAHILCVVAFVAWALFYLARRSEVALRNRAAWFVSFLLGGTAAALPLIFYVLNFSRDYFAHSKDISIFTNPDSPWLKLERVGPKIGLLVGRFIDFWDNLSWHPQSDYGDGSGTVPVVPLLVLLAALLGLALGWRKRGPLIAMSACFLLVLPFGPMLTMNGVHRRSFAMAPLLAALAAIAIVEVYRRAANAGRRFTSRKSSDFLLRGVVFGVLTAFGLFLTFENLDGFFAQSMSSRSLSWTFGEDMTETSLYLSTLPVDAHVYFYSQRWGCEYETRRFLAPNVAIENRSREFGSYSLALSDRASIPYFLLLGRYQADLPALKKLYPDNQIQTGPLNRFGEPTYISLRAFG